MIGTLCLGAVEHPQKRRRPWDKENDTIAASLPLEKAEPTKRGILSKVAKIYDPLGLASPISLGVNSFTVTCVTLNVTGTTSYQMN